MESFGYSDSPLELRIHAGCGDFSGATTKHQTRWAGFDEKILSLYARGMTVREIQSHLEEMYGTEVSPTLISSVTDAVMDEAKAWQARPLDALYPIRPHGAPQPELRELEAAQGCCR